MPRLIATAVTLILLLSLGAASAEDSCAPNCDFTHYYGPLDFTYVRLHGPYVAIFVRPGLFLYAHCGPDGSCSPHLISSGQRYRGRVTVRPLRRPRPY
jgi:hypothetical protein